jgi:hypothetical protein
MNRFVDCAGSHHGTAGSSTRVHALAADRVPFLEDLSYVEPVLCVSAAVVGRQAADCAQLQARLLLCAQLHNPSA